MAVKKSDRLTPSLIYIFKVAHDKHDARASTALARKAASGTVARSDALRETVSESKLVDIVREDLLSLLNTISFGSAENLDEAPEVRRSVLNYGFPDLARRTIDENRLEAISAEIETALVDFEPRLVRETIKARRDVGVKAADLKLRFVVNAELRAHPIDVPMEFIAELELDSGKIRIEKL